jgi:hypothetical protein
MTYFHKIGESRAITKAHEDGGSLVVWTLAIIFLVWMVNAANQTIDDDLHSVTHIEHPKHMSLKERNASLIDLFDGQ